MRKIAIGQDLTMTERTSFSRDCVADCLISLCNEVKELRIGTSVPEIDVENISSLSFYRDYVSPNQPVIIRNACRHWSALKKWNNEYFCSVFKNKDVVIAVTPNGYADAIASNPKEDIEYFVVPEERCMKMSDFIQVLDHSDQFPGVFYLQRQNSNLKLELPELLQDVDEEIRWASEAFGHSPDAVNFWMGDHRAVTSLHKDPYENIYCVVKGFKDFILHPPTDLPWIPHKVFPMATYRETSSGEFDIIPTKSAIHSQNLEENTLRTENDLDIHIDKANEVPWICIDPLDPDMTKYPLYRNASPLHVRVEAGDALFLPSLWFHHVRQSHKCIAINYWYDMQYDIKYAYHKFLESVSKLSV